MVVDQSARWPISRPDGYRTGLNTRSLGVPHRQPLDNKPVDTSPPDPQLVASSSGNVRSEDTLARKIAAAFVLYGALAVVFLAMNMPPFQNPDEPAHLLRAAQLADGVVVGSRFMVTTPDGRQFSQGGGPSDPAIMEALPPSDAMIGNPTVKATRDAWAPQVRWSNARKMVAFPFSAVYPPFFYIPAAIAVVAGRMIGATVVQSATAARLLTGAAAIAVGATAIACAGAAAIWIFAVLTLPMSLALTASSSQDALILALSALAVAMTVRIQRRRDLPNHRPLLWLAVALALVVVARPPYLTLILLPIALDQVGWRRRAAAVALVIVCLVVWSGITSVTTLSNGGAFLRADPRQQVNWLLANPLLVWPLIKATLDWSGQLYLDTFIGKLGRLDTELPVHYHYAAWAMLATAALAATLGLKGGPVHGRSRLLIPGGILIGAAGVFVLQYLTWNVPGNPVIDGVQGRYFLPLVLPVAALLPALGGTPFSRRLHNVLVAVVVAFPVVTLGVVMRTVVLRYYLG